MAVWRAASSLAAAPGYRDGVEWLYKSIDSYASHLKRDEPPKRAHPFDRGYSIVEF
jgi:hypothetical protein